MINITKAYTPKLTMPLNEEQQKVLTSVQEGRNIFLTGPGGTGKSYLIHHIVAELESEGKKVATTALTGCAALLLGHHAKTIHSWAGIGLGKDTAEKLAHDIKSMPWKHPVWKRWLTTKTLIIDEVSMMTPELLELLNTLGKLLRRCPTKPFGGIQVILVGDFFQLPPVVKTDSFSRQQMDNRSFLFESSVWKELDLKPCYLQTIVRQSDPAFQTLLNEARVGALSKSSLETLESRMNLDWQTQKIKPTLLFSRRAEVETINQMNLDALKGPVTQYEAKTIFSPIIEKGLTLDSPKVQHAIKKLDKDAPYKPNLELKVGAQVMLIYNIDQDAGLVNGSRGVIEGFTETLPRLPLVSFKSHPEPIPIDYQTWESEDVDGLERKQIPLLLAYSVTIHKVQGATLDSALIDIGPSTFEMGQAYVALSRVKSLDSLYIYDFQQTSFKTHPKVIEFYNTL